MTQTTQAPSRRRRTTAAGSALGAAVQELRVTAHLFQAPEDAQVSLEVVADIAVHHGRSTRAEEHKNRTSRHNPIGDTSVDLWKTLHNWVDAARSGMLAPELTTYVLHVSRPFAGALAEAFAAASTPEAVRATTQRALAQLLPARRDRDATEIAEDATALPADTRAHVEAVFSQDDGVLEAIIARFVLEFGSGDNWRDLRAVARVPFVDPSLADPLLHEMVGWVKQRITECIERRMPAVVEARAFLAHLRATYRRLDQRIILTSGMTEPESAEVEAQLAQMPMYLRQLELVDLHTDEAWAAATDFLRASNMRAEWGEQGVVHPNGFDAYERELTTTWRRGKRRVTLEFASASAVHQGQRLFDVCCENPVTLEGRVTPAEFCRGSYHTLADALDVGWHPDYQTLLRAMATRRRRRVGGAPGADRRA